MRIRQRNQIDLIRIVGQSAEAGGTALAVGQGDLIVVPRTRLQAGQLVMIEIHLLPLEIRRIRIDLDRDRVAQVVLSCAISDCGSAGFCALPYNDHAVRLGSQQIRSVFERRIRSTVIRSQSGRHHGRDHDHRQQQAEQTSALFSHLVFTPS